VRQRLLVGGELVSRSSSVLAVIDTQLRRSVPIADDWRAALERWLVPDFA
jgi:acyl-CoA thioesterase FadM